MTNHGEPAPNPGRAALELVYREAVYSVDLPAGRLRFRIGERLPGIEPFALITAYNPGHCRPGEAANAAANARLRECLASLRLEFVDAQGASLEGSHVEPSFAVIGISREAALALAQEFGQAAIAWFDGDTVELAWTTSPDPRPSA